MKTRTPSLGLLVLFCASLCFSVRAFAAATFVDLTAKEFKGPDADLSGFSLTKFGVKCEEGGTYTKGEPSYVSWENRSARTEPMKATYGIKKYTIHFRVKDRHGVVIHEEDFHYLRTSDGGRYNSVAGRVIHNNLDFNCDRDLVRFSKKIDLSFATVEFWVSGIEWMPKP